MPGPGLVWWRAIRHAVLTVWHVVSLACVVHASLPGDHVLGWYCCDEAGAVGTLPLPVCAVLVGSAQSEQCKTRAYQPCRWDTVAREWACQLVMCAQLPVAVVCQSCIMLLHIFDLGRGGSTTSCCWCWSGRSCTGRCECAVILEPSVCSVM